MTCGDLTEIFIRRSYIFLCSKIGIGVLVELMTGERS